VVGAHEGRAGAGAEPSGAKVRILRGATKLRRHHPFFLGNSNQKDCMESANKGQKTAHHRCLVTSPLPATDPEHSEPGGAGVRGRGALTAVGAHEGRAGRGRSRAVRKAAGSNPSGSYQQHIKSSPSLVYLPS
jgi:hypothetical protein